MPTATKGKGRQQVSDEEPNISFHGVAYVNMAPLLYPGVKKIQGAYLVKPFLDNEVYEKTKRKGNLADAAAQISSGINQMVTPTVASKPPSNKVGQKDTKVKVCKHGRKVHWALLRSAVRQQDKRTIIASRELYM